MVRKLLVVGTIHVAGLSAARENGFDTVVSVPADDAEKLCAEIVDADAMALRYVMLPEGLFDRAERLKVVSRHGVGTDNLDMPTLSRQGIQVWITGDTNSATVAEHAVLLMLASARRLAAAHAATIRGDFTARESLGAGELMGKTVLIVGFGRIGRHVARLLSGFGVRLLVCDPLAAVEDGLERVGLAEGLAQANFVTLHVPSSGAALLDQAALSKVRKGCVIVNCARGDLVDLDALHAGLQLGHVGAAGLDVFPQEPPAPHPIYNDPRLIATPHSAAMTEDCLERMAIETVLNAARGLRGDLDRAAMANHEAFA